MAFIYPRNTIFVVSWTNKTLLVVRETPFLSFRGRIIDDHRIFSRSSKWHFSPDTHYLFRKKQWVFRKSHWV